MSGEKGGYVLRLEGQQELREDQKQEVKKLPASAGDMGSIPGSGIPWRRKWQPTSVFLPAKFHAPEPGRLPSMALQSQT